MTVTPNPLSLLVLGYLHRHCRGHAAARSQKRIARDLRDLNLQVDVRAVRRRQLTYGCR